MDSLNQKRTIYTCYTCHMEQRRDVWRRCLMGEPVSVERKRDFFSLYVSGRRDVQDDILKTIKADLPRTFPNVNWVQEHAYDIEILLVMYAAIHKGDSYLQGFNYHMTILYNVFCGSEHAFADTWWCFSKVIGLIRPLIPDFNITWFHWSRQHWTNNLYTRIRKSRPQLHSIIEPHKEEFSALVTCKWFMIWFAQTVPWDDIFELWDILIKTPPQHLLRMYMLITHQILIEVAPTITYRWAHEPTNVLHALLSVHVKGIQRMAAKITL